MTCPKLYTNKIVQEAFERALWLLVTRKGKEPVEETRTIWITQGIEEEDEVWNMAIFHSQITNKA